MVPTSLLARHTFVKCGRGDMEVSGHGSKCDLVKKVGSLPSDNDSGRTPEDSKIVTARSGDEIQNFLVPPPPVGGLKNGFS